jgi:hypothetical protein
LKELSKRTDGEEGDRLIDEAIELFRQSVHRPRAIAGQEQRTDRALQRGACLGCAGERKTGLARRSGHRRGSGDVREDRPRARQGEEPALWAAVKQNEAELLRLVGQRPTDPARALQALKDVLRALPEAADGDCQGHGTQPWALICAEMGHTLVAALPLLDENDRRRMSAHAVAAFETAQRSISSPVGFGQDLEKLDGALKTASAAANPTAPSVAPTRQELIARSRADRLGKRHPTC